MIEKKIRKLEELIDIIPKLKGDGKKIVLCHGCYDLTHYGHSLHFLDAKSKGDVLVVTVTPDEFIEKGPGRPFFSQDIRIKQLSCLEPVDYVALNKWPTAVETIRALKPHFYVKGKEVIANKEIDESEKKFGDEPKKVSNLELELEALKSVGGEFYFTDQITFSSSSVINQITSAIPEESKEFLREIRRDYGSEKILEALKSLKDIRVLVLGDPIIDRYDFCTPLGKSSKERLIAYKFLESESHLGGVFAVANHAAGFTNNLELVTCMGNSHHEIINKGLNPRIKKNLFEQMDSETMVKMRYVDQYKLQKLFELYNIEELRPDEELEERVISQLDTSLPNSDMVVVSDFGHGMITERLIEYLAGMKKFLAINCQINSGNGGYNFITKYPRADFVSINDSELRLPFQEKSNSVEIPIQKLRRALGVEKINITLGKSGDVYFQEGKSFYSPVLRKDPLDTIGSGDAVFALTSMLAYAGVEPKLIPFLGNSIGSLATGIVGNRRAIDPTELKKFVSYILK